MALGSREFHDLVFDRRTIARTARAIAPPYIAERQCFRYDLDLPRAQSTVIQHGSCAGWRVELPERRGSARNATRIVEVHRSRFPAARAGLKSTVRPSIRGGVPVLKRATVEADRLELLGQMRPPSLPCSATRDPGARSDVDAAAQKRAGGDHDRLRAEPPASSVSTPLPDCRSPEDETRAPCPGSCESTGAARSASGRPVDRVPVALRARRPDRGSLASVEHPELEHREIRRAPHDPAEASTSRTTVPFATPPIAGLHDIWPIVSSAGDEPDAAPGRAAATAASVPAWPAPITTTSNSASVLSPSPGRMPKASNAGLATATHRRLRKQ